MICIYWVNFNINIFGMTQMSLGEDWGKMKSGNTVLLQVLFLHTLFSHVHRNHLPLFVHTHRNLMDKNLKINISEYNLNSEQWLICVYFLKWTIRLLLHCLQSLCFQGQTFSLSISTKPSFNCIFSSGVFLIHLSFVDLHNQCWVSE